MSPGAPRADLERWYDDHATALFAFALNLTRREADARDLLQDVFVKLARHPHRMTEAVDERAFLLRLIHNAAIDLFRRRQTRTQIAAALEEELPRIFAATSDPDEAVFRDALSAALSEIPPDQRAVIHLKLWEGLTFDAIADLLEIPLNTAASRYRYGLDKLRQRLRPLYEELR